MIDRRGFRVFDYMSIALLAGLLAFGVLLVASASGSGSSDLARKQAIWGGTGLLLAIIAGAIDYRLLASRAYAIWTASVVLLAGVTFFAPPISNARSWLQLGGFTLQPSEFAKLATILALARLFAEREPRQFGLQQMVIPVTLVGVPVLLTILQPDLGTAMAFLPVLAGITWVAGIRVRPLVGLAAGAAAVSPFLLFFGLLDYQRARLTSFLRPEDDPLGNGYQLIQSKIAIGSGGMIGKGLFRGTQSQLNFLPEQHNDFIMALLGEELGFLGVTIVLTLYAGLLLRLLSSARLARDRFGSYAAVGVASLLAFHLVINVAMVIGYAPITGIPLPLLSYGGSSTLSTAIAIGVAVSIRSRRFGA